MSTTTYGPPVFLDGPLPVAPPGSLLEIPGVVVSTGDTRWMNGASVWAYPTEEPQSWDPCYTGTFRTKAEGDGSLTATFGAYVAYIPITCSAITVGEKFDEFRDRAEKAMDAVMSYAVEQALSQGIALSSNPFFSDANVTILGAGAPLTPMVALSYLEDAIGATGRQGMIHATPGTATQWFDQDRIDRLVPTADNTPSLSTVMGTPVAAGGGYLGAQPSGGAAPAAGQAWAFATGPVNVRLASMELIPIEDVLERELNDITYRAERFYLATWDTALQAAALVDWSP